MYKYSRFNHLSEHEGSKYCFNFLSGSLIVLKEEHFELVKNKTNLEFLRQNNPELFEVLKEQRIILEEDVNELHILKFRNNRDVYLTQNFRLTILPTLDCNLKCWYCYEQHVKGSISEDIQNRIVLLLEKKIKEKSLSSLELDWFGGEPLLEFNKVVYPLSKKIMSLVKKNDIHFNHHITTNGFLLDEEIIKKLNDIDLLNFQITLDGDRELHNKIKKHNGIEETFDKTISNIILLCKVHKTARVGLRINYTHETLDSIENIIYYFPKEIRSQITVTFQIVWQIKTHNNFEQLHEKLRDLTTKFIRNGYLSNFSYFNLKTGFNCYADRFHQAVVSTNGDVYKCTARDFALKTNSDGYLNENGDIEWNNKIFRRFNKATFDNDECLDCEYTPICLGPCSQKLLELEKGKKIRDICGYEYWELFIKDFAANFIRNNYSTFLKIKKEFYV